MSQVGIVQGASHSKNGVKAKIKATGKVLELEGGEVIVNKKTVASNKLLHFEGKKRTPKEILHFLNTMEGNGDAIIMDFDDQDYKDVFGEGGEIPIPIEVENMENYLKLISETDHYRKSYKYWKDFAFDNKYRMKTILPVPLVALMVVNKSEKPLLIEVENSYPEKNKELFERAVVYALSVLLTTAMGGKDWKVQGSDLNSREAYFEIINAQQNGKRT